MKYAAREKRLVQSAILKAKRHLISAQSKSVDAAREDMFQHYFWLETAEASKIAAELILDGDYYWFRGQDHMPKWFAPGEYRTTTLLIERGKNGSNQYTRCAALMKIANYPALAAARAKRIKECAEQAERFNSLPIEEREAAIEGHVAAEEELRNMRTPKARSSKGYQKKFKELSSRLIPRYLRFVPPYKLRSMYDRSRK